MIISDGLSEIEYKGGTIVTIGKFDGIHAGHQKLLKYMSENKGNLKSVVFTFTRNSNAFNGESLRLLSEEERHEKFTRFSVDYLIEYDLNDETARMEPEDFARIILRDRLHAKEIVCGSDLSFGYKGRGDVNLLRKMEKELDIKVTVIRKAKYQGEDISSTRIRKAMAEGNVTAAKYMLKG